MTTLLIFIIVCLFVADIILLVSLNRIMGENGRLREKYNKLEKRLTDKLYESAGIIQALQRHINKQNYELTQKVEKLSNVSSIGIK